MDSDQQRLIQRLFAQATMIATICQEWAIAGQSHELTLNGYDYTNLELGRTIDDLRLVHNGIHAIIKLAGGEIRQPKS
jgi:hypothetical protein